MRVETLEGSGLADKLIEGGYRIDRCGIGMRVVGTSSSEFAPVEILEVLLPP
jgi:hypothetical protein